MIANLRDALKTGQSDVATLLKDIHDAARALRTEIDLSVESAWGRQLAAARAETARLLEAEIDNLPSLVRRLLRPRNGRDAIAPLDSMDVDDVEGKARARRHMPQLCGRTCGQRGNAPRAFRAADLLRQRHAGPARSTAHLAARRTRTSATRRPTLRSDSAPSCLAPNTPVSLPKPPILPPKTSRRPQKPNFQRDSSL